MALSLSFCPLLFLLLLVLFSAPGRGAVALNHHQLKMHMEWNRASEREDWTDWNAAFAMADLGDGNSHGHVHEVAKVRTARPGITGRRCNGGLGCRFVSIRPMYHLCLLAKRFGLTGTETSHPRLSVVAILPIHNLSVLVKVFKEHFNIIHDRMEHNHAGLTRAEENHFKVTARTRDS
jgi:hypothetical protein